MQKMKRIIIIMLTITLLNIHAFADYYDYTYSGNHLTATGEISVLDGVIINIEEYGKMLILGQYDDEVFKQLIPGYQELLSNPIAGPVIAVGQLLWTSKDAYLDFGKALANSNTTARELIKVYQQNVFQYAGTYFTNAASLYNKGKTDREDNVLPNSKDIAAIVNLAKQVDNKDMNFFNEIKKSLNNIVYLSTLSLKSKLIKVIDAQVTSIKNIPPGFQLYTLGRYGVGQDYLPWHYFKSPKQFVSSKNDVPLRHLPFSDNKIIKRLGYNTPVSIVASTYNKYGHLWFLTSDGFAIYSENINADYEPTATPKPQSSQQAQPHIPNSSIAEKMEAPVISVTDKSVTVTWSGTNNASYYNVYLVQAPWSWESIKYSGETQSTSFVFNDVIPGEYQAFVIPRPNKDTVQSGWSYVRVLDVCIHPTMSEWTRITEPTNEMDGKEERVCRDCSYTERRPIASIGSLSEEITPVEEPIVTDSNNPATQFLDVDENSYYYKPVQWAVEKSITRGLEDLLFAPNRPCSHAEIITFLWRALGSPEPESVYVHESNQISTNAYYYKAVAWAADRNIVSHYGFNPLAPCSRSDVVQYLWKLSGKPVGFTHVFLDVTPRDSYNDAVSWSIIMNITTGTSPNQFSPKQICSRGEIVTFLYRAFLWGRFSSTTNGKK